MRFGGNNFNYFSENKLTKLTNFVQFIRMLVLSGELGAWASWALPHGYATGMSAQSGTLHWPQTITGNRATAETGTRRRQLRWNVFYTWTVNTERSSRKIDKTFFQQLTQPDSCFNHLLPPKRDISDYMCLCRCRTYKLSKTSTKQVR